MKRRVFLAGWAAAPALAQKPYGYFLTGSAEDAKGKTSPGYVLMGGGKDVDRAFQWMLARCGGGDVVVIRASGADGYNPYIAAMGGADSVESLVIATPEAAREPFVLERILRAEALFIAGGDQWNYVRVWGDSPVRAAVQELIDRGVPVGGTSAGLAVMGRFVFTAEKDTVTSAQAMADPYHERVRIGDALMRIPALRGVITDSHFAARDRMGRTLVFLARLLEDGSTQDARAIAVDERTAALVEADGRASIVGDGAVYFLRARKKAEMCRAGTPLTFAEVEAYRAKAGGGFDLTKWSGTGGRSYGLAVKAGVVSASEGKVY
jgi:cyanophycinase